MTPDQQLSGARWAGFEDVLVFARSDDEATAGLPGVGTERVKVRVGDELVELRPDDLVELRVGQKGRVVIPAALRHHLGISEGVLLVARTEGHRLILEPKEAIKQRLQDEFAAIGASMADELLEERRRSAQREAAEE